MKRMTKMKSALACVCAVLMLALAIVPMFALTAFAADGAWTLVTSAADLAAGDKVIIVAKDADYAMSTTQNSNNRAQAAVTKNSDNTLTFTSEVQQFTLEAGTTSDTFAFNTGSGYIYSASSSKNYLRTETSLSANSSWTIEITTAGVATVKSNGANTRNWLRYNSSSSLFASYSSGQADICIYKWIEAGSEPETPDTPDCAHENTITESVEATCTAAGYVKIYCANEECNALIKNEEVKALGHDLDDGVVTTPATCSAEGVLTKTCQRDGCNHTATSVIGKLAHNYVDNKCSECGQAKPKDGIATTYTFSNYTAGTQYAKDEEHVLDENTTIVTNDCHFTTQLRIYSSSSNNGYAIIKSVNPINKVGVNAGNKVDTLVIYGSNDDGANWTEAATISVTSTSYNDYSVDLAAEYKWLKLDVEGTQQIRLQSITLTTVEVEEEEEVETAIIKGATLNIGNDLSMKYRVVLPVGANASDYSMKFTMNGKSYTVTAFETVENGYLFSFNEIAPQCMGDTITAELIAGGATVATNEYSVLQYAIDTIKENSSNEKLITLVSDLLAYGAAAQSYKNYKTDALVNANVDGYAPSEAAPALADKITALTGAGSDTAKITAAGVYFDYTNKIYVKLTATTLEGVTVKVNGTAVDVMPIDGGYIAYSEAVSALDFGDSYTVTLEVGGEVAQTLTYSINSYVYTKCANAGDELSAMQSLALALYRYGASAAAYAEA